MAQINRLAVNKSSVAQSRNPNITQFNRNDFVSQPYPKSTLRNVLIYGNKASKDIDMSGNSITNVNQITATIFVGDISGNSKTATNIAGGAGGSIPYQFAANTTRLLANGNAGQVLTSQGTTLAPQWTTLSTPATPTLATVLSAGSKASTAIDMSSNAITNATQITATTFIGDLSGNATTATSASNIKTTTNSVSSNFYIPFVSLNSTSNQSLLVNNLTYNPSTSNLTATTFTGALVGNASSATNATTATNITTVSDNTSGTYYIPFSKTTAQTSTALYLDDITTTLTYNPSTATISTSNIDSAAGVNLQYGASTKLSTTTTGATIVGTLLAPTINGTTGINLQYNGTTQSTITTSGVQETLLTTQGTATFSTTTLTMVSAGSAPYPTLYTNLVSISGTTNTISAITPPTNMPINAMYMVYITNSGTGVLTINATGFTNIKTTYTNAVSVPAGGFALGTLTKLSSTLFIWSVNVVA